MRVISTVICLFAAFIMMATPVMACCVTGHVDMSADSVKMADASAPPCHTPADVRSDNSDTQTPEKYCPSCDDCAVSSAFMADSDPVTHAKTDLTFVTLINTPAEPICLFNWRFSDVYPPHIILSDPLSRLHALAFP